jgi:hypothetical protein
MGQLQRELREDTTVQRLAEQEEGPILFDIDMEDSELTLANPVGDFVKG